MKAQFNNTALASFLFWSENELISKGEAYKNYTSRLFYKEDLRLDGYVGYSAPFKQWVYNKNITGAYICSAISGSINLSNNQSGMKVDYENGRVLLPSSFGTGLNISGSYAFKEINFYVSTETEEQLLVSSKFYLNSRFINQRPTAGIAPYDQVTPAIFVNFANSDTNPFAFGGLKESKLKMSIVVMTENISQLDATLGIFSECKEKQFPQLSIYEDPLDEYGNVKTGIYPSGYNYQTILNQKYTPGNLFYIEDVWTSKISDRIKMNDDLFAGIVDFTISKVRII